MNRVIFYKPIFLFCVFSFLLLNFPIVKAQEFKTGCILDKELYEKVPLSAPLMRGDYKDLPAKASLKKYAPTPQNQGSFGTCVGWSTAYAARTILASIQQNWTNLVLITENAFSPFFIYEQAKPASDVYCQEGTSLFNALEIIKEIGVVRIAEFANQCGQMITNKHEEKANEFKIKDYKRLFESGASKKTQIVKKSLAENKPVVIGIQCCAESFLNAKGIDFWKLQASDNANPEGGHALTVIGYDDEMYGGAFELMNSWGTVWGNQGFIWMSYKDFDKYCFEAYEMTTPYMDASILAGKIRLTLSAGKDMEAYYKGAYYEMKEAYNSGTLFRLHISNNEPAYVYAFGSDLSKKNYKVFPHAENISPYLGYKGNNVAIPDEDHYIQMDNNKGIDYFCVLYSTEKLDIDTILKDMEQAQGNFQTRLNAVLGDKMVNPKDIHYSTKGEIGFKGIAGKKTVIPVIIAINHI